MTSKFLASLVILASLVTVLAWVGPPKSSVGTPLAYQDSSDIDGFIETTPVVKTVWEEINNRFHLVEMEGVSLKCNIYHARQKCPNTGEPFGPAAIIKMSYLHPLMHQEASIYKHLDNSELFAKIYEYHEPQTPEDVSAIIMERGYTDIRTYLKNFGPFRGTALLEVAKVTADILCHFHEKNLIWTEMKSQNFILMDGDRVKAIDFESCIPVDHRNVMYTAPYAPPEFALEDLCGRNLRMDFSFDIWSYGMLLYEIATGSLYFHGKFDENDRVRIFSYLKNVEELDLNSIDTLNPQLKDLIARCLKIDPRERPTIQEVLTHPYFDNHEPVWKPVLYKHQS